MIVCKSFVNSIISWEQFRPSNSNLNKVWFEDCEQFEECILLTLEILNQILNMAKVDDGNF